jgi:hypothetical protein
MTHAIPTNDPKNARPRLLAASFAVGMAALVFGAAPAEAGSEFKNGFEDELGRIVAHHVAAVGHAVIAAPLIVHGGRYHAPPRYRPLPPPARYHGHAPRGRAHGHYKHRRGHDHYRGRRHAARPARVTVIKEYGGRDRGHRRGRHHR